MKKSSFVALVMGTVSGTLFAIGMCMALLPAWNAFRPGVIMGGAGILLALISVITWRKLEHKPAIKVSGKIIGTCLLGVAGSLILGAGMSLVMIWSNIVLGIILGLVGIVLLLCLIPVCIGIK